MVRGQWIAILVLYVIDPSVSLIYGVTLASHQSRQSICYLSMSNVARYDDSPSPRQLVSRGMQAFREGKVEESIDLFDQADKAVPDGSLRPFLWQRGISYYYADQFDKGSNQFRYDVQVNPLDVEEIVWDIACLSRLDPDHVPPPSMMSLPRGKQDRRKIMSNVYSLFRGEASELSLAEAGNAGTPSDEFYSRFYLGLYCESRGEIAKAESYMKAAHSSEYATGVGFSDYMTSCAQVHCRLRGWG